jgi:hypothetical protein
MTACLHGNVMFRPLKPMRCAAVSSSGNASASKAKHRQIDEAINEAQALRLTFLHVQGRGERRLDALADEAAENCGFCSIDRHIRALDYSLKSGEMNDLASPCPL